MRFLDAAPKIGDSNWTLLAKICQQYSDLCPAANAIPDAWDTQNNLLFKIARALSICFSCSNPAAPSNLFATDPAPETTVTWTDNATNETSYELRYRNLTQGGGFIETLSYPANSTGTGTGVIIIGAMDGDDIEIQVRAVSGSCASDWISITVTAVIPI